MLDYKLIEALAMVVQEGGFDKAAKRLHITQSAVSQRIKQLEDRVGQVLLSRTSPPQATRAGQRVIKHCLQVRRLEDDLLDALPPAENRTPVVLAIGINDDSLATWFVEAVAGFLRQTQVFLDLRPDDQEQTHQMLKRGEVIGCISAKPQPMQGCRVEYLGRMDYRMLATPGFFSSWFPDGMTPSAMRRAPLLVYNRKDELHLRFFERAAVNMTPQLNVHYLPSSEKFVDFILKDLAYGMLPDQQSLPLLENGRLVELLPGSTIEVGLYWHCWNLKSALLEKFSHHLAQQARVHLKQ
jgi:LysR family transcriptional regulator (chromosome initiation inhibitor)